MPTAAPSDHATEAPSGHSAESHGESHGGAHRRRRMAKKWVREVRRGKIQAFERQILRSDGH